MTDSRSRAAKRRIAVGWVKVLLLPERLRRRRRGHSQVEFHDHAGAGCEAGVGREAPRCRSSGPAPSVPERGGNGGGWSR